MAADSNDTSFKPYIPASAELKSTFGVLTELCMPKGLEIHEN